MEDCQLKSFLLSGLVGLMVPTGICQPATSFSKSIIVTVIICIIVALYLLGIMIILIMGNSTLAGIL